MRSRHLTTTFALTLALLGAPAIAAAAPAAPLATCEKLSIGKVCRSAQKTGDRYKIWVDFTANKVVRSAQLGYYNPKTKKKIYENYAADMSTNDVRSAVWNNQNTTAGFAGCVKYKKNGKKKEECGWA